MSDPIARRAVALVCDIWIDRSSGSCCVAVAGGFVLSKGWMHYYKLPPCGRGYVNSSCSADRSSHAVSVDMKVSRRSSICRHNLICWFLSLANVRSILIILPFCTSCICRYTLIGAKSKSKRKKREVNEISYWILSYM